MPHDLVNKKECYTSLHKLLFNDKTKLRHVDYALYSKYVRPILICIENCFSNENFITLLEKLHNTIHAVEIKKIKTRYEVLKFENDKANLAMCIELSMNGDKDLVDHIVEEELCVEKKKLDSKLSQINILTNELSYFRELLCSKVLTPNETLEKVLNFIHEKKKLNLYDEAYLIIDQAIRPRSSNTDLHLWRCNFRMGATNFKLEYITEIWKRENPTEDELITALIYSEKICLEDKAEEENFGKIKTLLTKQLENLLMDDNEEDESDLSSDEKAMDCSESSVSPEPASYSASSARLYNLRPRRDSVQHHKESQSCVGYNFKQ